MEEFVKILGSKKNIIISESYYNRFDLISKRKRLININECNEKLKPLVHNINKEFLNFYKSKYDEFLEGNNISDYKLEYLK